MFLSTGTVTRNCGEGGLWSETNYDCIREAVIDVQNKVVYTCVNYFMYIQCL